MPRRQAVSGGLLGLTSGLTSALGSLDLSAVGSIVNKLSDALGSVTGTVTSVVTSLLNQLQGQLGQLTEAVQAGDVDAEATLDDIKDTLQQAADQGYDKARQMLRKIEGMM